MKCTKCTVGPGKFEGEGPLTALAYWHATNGNADESHGPFDCFKSPLNFDADEGAIEFAQSLGFCAECIEAANDEAREASGAICREDDCGFVYCETFASADAYHAAVDEVAREYVNELDADDDEGSN